MREAHRVTMLNTSVFICIPLIDAIETEPLFSVILFLTLVASLLHWSKYQFNSIWHWMDRFCVIIVFIYLFVFHFNGLNIILCTSAIAFFLCGRFSLNPQHKFIFHLLFRYLAFWTCAQVSSTSSATKLGILSVLYFIIIQLSLMHTSA